MAKQILKTAKNMFITPIFEGILGLGGKKPAPVEKTATVMPTTDDAAVQRAKKRAMAMQASRGGRTSTMLTGDSDTLGG